MNGIRLLICVGLVTANGAIARAETPEIFHFTDASWVKDAGERLARCAGAYRGVAAVLRKSGRDEPAAYADQVGSGALFAAYLLLTSPVAADADAPNAVDVNVRIDTLAWGTERNVVMADAQRESGLPTELRACTQLSALQSAVLHGAMAVSAVAAAPLDP